jgi:hypothetical protein
MRKIKYHHIREETMRKETFSGKEMIIGEYKVVIDDLPLRAKVFIEDVMGKNMLRTRPTSEEYLTKLATGLIHRLMRSRYKVLAEEIAEAAFKYDYPIVGYKAKFYMYYYMMLEELGHTPEDPYKDTREQSAIYRQVREARAKLSYDAQKFMESG